MVDETHVVDRVIESVTPKGVEHRIRCPSLASQAFKVIEAVTPKSGEH